jgi:HTH-type transcriptional regulator / antitoxin HipB
MIQNERQYKITKTKLRDLKLDLSGLDAPDSDLHTRLMLARKNSLNILIGELEQEIAEYDRLKSGQITKFPIESLGDLPRVMIEARIAVGMTQKELAEKIGVQEQQIQKYEANHYRAVGFDRLQEVMSALDMTISKAVMQLGSRNWELADFATARYIVSIGSKLSWISTKGKGWHNSASGNISEVINESISIVESFVPPQREVDKSCSKYKKLYSLK